MRRALAAGLLLAAACGDAASSAVPAGEAAIRDSAGVEIVEHPAAAPELAWTASAVPAVVIGAADGPASGQLYAVTGALRLSDGRIVVADGGSGEIRSFDPEGTFLTASGGRGQGPGEFQHLSWLGSTAGDSLVAWDAVAGRLSVFDPEGRFVRSAAPGLDGLFPQAVGLLAGGSLVLATGSGSDAVLAAGDRPFRDTVAYVRVAADGATADTLGRFPGREQVVIAPPGGRGTFSIEGVVFGRVTHAAAAGDHLHVAPGDRYEIRTLDRSGAVTRILRRAHEPRPVRPQDVRDHYDRLVTVGAPPPTPDEQARIPVAETFPPLSGLLVDAGGNLWVRESQRPEERGDGALWTVFDPAGRMRGTIRAPPRLTVRQVGSDWLLGTTRDEEGVERVQLHALVK